MFYVKDDESQNNQDSSKIIEDVQETKNDLDRVLSDFEKTSDFLSEGADVANIPELQNAFTSIYTSVADPNIVAEPTTDSVLETAAETAAESGHPDMSHLPDLVTIFKNSKSLKFGYRKVKELVLTFAETITEVHKRRVQQANKNGVQGVPGLFCSLGSKFKLYVLNGTISIVYNEGQEDEYREVIDNVLDIGFVTQLLLISILDTFTIEGYSRLYFDKSVFSIEEFQMLLSKFAILENDEEK